MGHTTNISISNFTKCNKTQRNKIDSVSVKDEDEQIRCINIKIIITLKKHLLIFADKKFLLILIKERTKKETL